MHFPTPEYRQLCDDRYYKMVFKSVDLILPNIFIQSRKNKLTETGVVKISGYLLARIFQFIKEEYKLEFRIHDDILEDWNLKEYIPDYGRKHSPAPEFANVP